MVTRELPVRQRGGACGISIAIDARLAGELNKSDPERAAQLLKTAREAMAAGGALTITIDEYQCGEDQAELPAGEYICLSVSDTGFGMTEETQSRIFEPFFSSKKGGSGLGLFITRTIVEAHDGKMAVESEWGKGSTFSFVLPLWQASESSSSTTTPSSVTP